MQQLIRDYGTILDDFQLFEDFNFIKKEIKKMFYLLNADDMKIVNKFKTEIDANEVGRKSKFGYLVVHSEECLKQLTIKHLKELQKNIEAKGSVDNKTEACPRIFAFIENMEFDVIEVQQKKAPANKGTGKKHQGIGDFVMIELAKGTFEGKKNQEIADVANEKFPGATVSAKSVGWYKWKLNKSDVKK